MSKDTVVAKRYAQALFEIASKEQRTLEVEEELKAVVQSFVSESDLQKFISSPNISESVKVDVLRSSLQSKVSPAVLNCLELLVKRGRTGIFEELLDSYVKIKGDALGLADATVYSTYLLSDKEKETIAQEFGARVNKKIRIDNKIDSSLLGGLKVVIGDTLFDGSLSGKLERLEKSFNRRV